MSVLEIHDLHVTVDTESGPSEILRGSVPPCLLYWWFLAVVLAIFSVLFYLV